MTIRDSTVAAIFSTLKAQQKKLVILRNYDELTTSTGNDVDLLIAADDLKDIEEILRTEASERGFVILNRATFSPISIFIGNLETCQQLHFDLFVDLKWRGFDILQAETVRNESIDRKQFFVPAPIHEAALNLLTRLLYHGYVKDKYKLKIVESFAKSPGLAKSTLAEPFGDKAAIELVDFVLAEDWHSIEAYTYRWRRLLVVRRLRQTPWRVITSLWSDTKRLLRRFAVPPGFMIVMLGSDGSGKSSVALAMMSALEPTFAKEKSKHLHWKPSIFRNRTNSAEPVTNPHEKPPRKLLLSTLYFLYHWLDFILGSQLLLRPILFRNGLVVIDRYFLDLFVDPKRYRLNTPTWLLTAAYRFVLKPDLVIVLDAPPEVLQRRKQEMPFDETTRQRKAYLDLAGQLSNSHVVDASQPLEQVVADVQSIVLNYLAERTQKRLGIS